MFKSNGSESNKSASKNTAVLVYIDADTLAGKSDEDGKDLDEDDKDLDEDCEDLDEDYDPSDAISTVVVCSNDATQDEKLTAITARKSLLQGTDASIKTIGTGPQSSVKQMKDIVLEADDQTAEIRFIDGTTYDELTANGANVEFVSYSGQMYDPTSGIVKVSPERMQRLHASKDGSTQEKPAGGWSRFRLTSRVGKM